MKKILIINFFGIGDVLFTTPLIENIKLNIPDASIGFLTSSRAVSILKNNSSVNRIFIYDREEFVQVARRSRIAYWRKGSELLSAIKKEKYEAVIDLSLNGYMSFLMTLIGIPRRIGLNYKKRSQFLTTKIELKGYEERHVVDHYFDLMQHLGLKVLSRKLSFSPTKEDAEWAQKTLGGLDSRRPVFTVIPGGGASWGKMAVVRRWPTERYGQLVNKLIEKYNAQIILLGDAADRPLCQQIIGMAKSPLLDLSGQTSLGQLAALLSQCSFSVINDSGLVHLATATTGVKMISIYGPVDERVYGPYPSEKFETVTADVFCRPCYRRFAMPQCSHLSCLQSIQVDQVFNRIVQILERPKNERTVY